MPQVRNIGKTDSVFLIQAGGPQDVWSLVISQLDYRTERKSVTVYWTVKGKPNFGYNLNNIVFKLTKAR
jgi:hypothetical protein